MILKIYNKIMDYKKNNNYRKKQNKFQKLMIKNYRN